MASHHHHQHPTPCYYSHCYCTTYAPSHHHAPPPPDPHLHFHHHAPPPPDPHLHFHHHTPPPPDPYLHHQPPPPLPPQPHLYSPQAHLPNLHQFTPRFEERCFQEESITNPTLSSLLRRIAALETVLRRRSSSSSSHSLRNAAARTIQTHFRAFLLRRSRTLRQLKDLASIKSELSFLKLSISEKPHFDYDIVCQKVRALLLKLADIQGGDPMIRDGKNSISRDLNRFLDYIDGICLERRGLSIGVSSRHVRNNLKSRVSNSERNMENKKCGNLKIVNDEKLRGLVERIDKLAVELDEEEGELADNPAIPIRCVSGNRSNGLMKLNGGVQVQPKKRVSFAEDGKVYRLVRRNSEPYLDEDNCDDSIDGEDLVDAIESKNGFYREIEEIGLSAKETVNDEEDEVELEDGGSSSRSSDGEKALTSYPRGKK